jgi:predicted RNase H-like HicB family nuclease
MNDPGTISAQVRRRGDLFIATTSQFPQAMGQGATIDEALDSLGKALEQYRVSVGQLERHPLCPTIREWFHSSTGPALPFLPESEFYAVLESRNMDAVVTQQVIETYHETAILGSALVGGEYDEGIHEALYTASEHPLGFALAHAAGLASRIPQFFAAFSKSTRTPEFLKALEAWAERNELTELFDGKEELKWVNRNLVAQEHPAASFWQNACQGGFENMAKFNKALTNEVRNAESAARDEKKRRKNGTEERDAEYIHSIKIWWVPGALWCLSDSGIVATLDPEKTSGMIEAYDKVRRNISTLGFSKSRLKTS